MTIAIIDADVVAYQACETRGLNSQGFKVISLEDPEYTAEEDAAYLTGAWLKYQDIMTELCEICFTSEYRAAVKGENNFRNEIYPEYKANRHADPKKRNPFVPRLRTMAVENGMAVAAHGMEADDLLRIWQQECVAAGVDYIICSIDKDLRCIPGRHYLMHKKQFIDVSEEEATRFYYEQLLQGDPTDNIKGIPRVGPVKAQKYLQDCKTEKEFQYTVSEAYQSYFGNEWEQELILNGRLIYLLKSKDDEFTLDGWNLCPYTPYVPPPDITQVPGFEPEKTIPESITKPMGFRSEAYGLNKLTADLKEANDDLEAMIKNGMKPLPKKESIAPIIQQEEATTAVPVPVFSADWGKKK